MSTMRPRYAESEEGFPSRDGIVKLRAFGPTVALGPTGVDEGALKNANTTIAAIVSPAIVASMRGECSDTVIQRSHKKPPTDAHGARKVEELMQPEHTIERSIRQYALDFPKEENDLCSH